MPEFDEHCKEYAARINKSVKFSGDTLDYFIEYKAIYAARYAQGEMRVLDFGCGVGLLSNFLKKHLPLAQLDGFDVSSKSLEAVPAHLKEQGIFSNQMAALRAPYDLIVAANVFHHIAPNERQGTVNMLKGLLAEGGQLFIFEHNPLNPLTVKIVKECPFDEGVQLLTPGEIGQYFKKADLNTLKKEYIIFFPHMLSMLRWSEHWLAWCPLGAQFAVMAKKEKLG